MAEQKPYIFRSAIRALFSSFFGVIGAFVGLIVVFILIGLLVSGGKRELEVPGSYTMLADGDGERGPLRHGAPLLLAVDVRGIIGTEELSGNSMRKILERSQEGSLEGRIHGVLLMINSPGGSVFDSDTIYRLVQQYKRHYNVPVYTYVDGLCASGGMYIACASDKIFASDVSLVGSVGVFANFVNVSKGLEKIGVEAFMVSAGKDKGALNPLLPRKEGDDADMRNAVGYFYDQFIDVVTRARPRLDQQALVEEYGARVYPAPQSQSYGYIDGVVNDRESVIAALAEEAGVSDDYQVIELEEKSWLDSIVKGSWLSGQIRHTLDLPIQTQTLPSGYLYLYDETLPH